MTETKKQLVIKQIAMDHGYMVALGEDGQLYTWRETYETRGDKSFLVRKWERAYIEEEIEQAKYDDGMPF